MRGWIRVGNIAKINKINLSRLIHFDFMFLFFLFYVVQPDREESSELSSQHGCVSVCFVGIFLWGYFERVDGS